MDIQPYEHATVPHELPPRVRQDDPSTLAREETVADGNSILGHILGSKEVSQAVAGNPATQSGLGPNALKKLLPIAATMVMGSLAKQQVGQTNTVATGGGKCTPVEVKRRANAKHAG